MLLDLAGHEVRDDHGTPDAQKLRGGGHAPGRGTQVALRAVFRHLRHEPARQPEDGRLSYLQGRLAGDIQARQGAGDDAMTLRHPLIGEQATERVLPAEDEVHRRVVTERFGCRTVSFAVFEHEFFGTVIFGVEES